MKEFKICGIGNYKRKPKYKAGSIHKAYPNHLKQCFITNSPNESWVSDITYIRTHEGWLYLAIILDLFSRKVIGWATAHRQTTSLLITALKKTILSVPKNGVILHSDQGSQYSSYDYKTFLKYNNITPSMSRRGNCYDNAVAESQLERIYLEQEKIEMDSLEKFQKILREDFNVSFKNAEIELLYNKFVKKDNKKV